MMAAAAAAKAKQLSTLLLRNSCFRKIQVRPMYTMAGLQRKVSLSDVLKELRSLKQSLKPSEGWNQDFNRRIAKLEALHYFGGILLGVALSYTFAQAIFMHNMEQDIDNLDQRVSALENARHGKLEVVIEKTVRSWWRYVTVVKGLELFGVKPSDASKKLGKKFATGVSVVKGPTEKVQIDVQGDVSSDIVQFIRDTWPHVPESAIFFIEDGRKIAAAR